MVGLLSVVLLVVVALVEASSTSCNSAIDCSLNGVCQQGTCLCDVSWLGPRCSTLNLLPASKEAGFHPPFGASRDSTSSWGGAVARIRGGGGWGMISSELLFGCGINSWTRNSRVVLATSTTASGPFAFNRTLFGPFAHEPSLARAPNGSWVLYFAQYRDSCTAKLAHTPCVCSAHEGTPKNCSSEIPVSECPHPTWMATAPALEGPWSVPREVPMLDCNRTFCQHDMVRSSRTMCLVVTSNPAVAASRSTGAGWQHSS